MKTEVACLNCGHLFNAGVETGSVKIKQLDEKNMKQNYFYQEKTKSSIDIQSLDEESLSRLDVAIAQEKFNRLCEDNLDFDEKRNKSDSLMSIHRSKRFKCPNCQHKMFLLFNFQFIGPISDIWSEEDDSPEPIKEPELPKKDIAIERQKSEIAIFIDKCRAQGVFDSFCRATTSHFSSDKSRLPRSLENYFLQFILAIQPFDVTVETIKKLMPTEPAPGKICLWNALGVIMATTESYEIISFFPKNFVLLMKRSKNDLASKFVNSIYDEANSWIRTKNGYVPADCKIFLEHLKSQGIGVRSGANG